ncbi:MAG TPA: 3-methyl-2-oxobutanoate dehydrogenase subunit VorB [bacterium]|nr:3-methyl-2-oxobutanoate dehydrogenase subunit VorB [bacterium]
MKKLVKGNEAVVIGSLVAGCTAYYGYPITPASEIAHSAAEWYPPLGRTFLQAESEIGAINMVFGAASSGKRVMTASSGPGISLKMEGVSYLAGAELPAVIVDVMRVGPGLGNIGPEQGDYFQVVKGGGHGNYRVIVLAPASVREMYDDTIRAFDLADRYRTPVFVLADAVVGQMMEPIEISEVPVAAPAKPWQVDATAATDDNLITSIYLDFNDMERHVRRLEEKYARIAAAEAQAECYRTDGAELILTGYGIVSRILKNVVDDLRARGVAAGLIRPRTLWPFPADCYRRIVAPGAKVMVVELSTGQFVEDVRLTLPQHAPALYGRVGGNVPTQEEIIAAIGERLGVAV